MRQEAKEAPDQQGSDTKDEGFVRHELLTYSPTDHLKKTRRLSTPPHKGHGPGALGKLEGEEPCRWLWHFFWTAPGVRRIHLNSVNWLAQSNGPGPKTDPGVIAEEKTSGAFIRRIRQRGEDDR